MSEIPLNTVLSLKFDLGCTTRPKVENMMNDNILCGNLDHNSPLILTGNSEKLKETVHT